MSNNGSPREARESKAMEKMKRIGVRTFTEILSDLATGDVEKRLTSDLAELVRAVEEVGEKGTLKLELTVTKGPKVMHVHAKIETKAPKAPLENTAFFADERGGLHVENPRQVNMFNGPRSTGDDGGAS